MVNNVSDFSSSDGKPHKRKLWEEAEPGTLNLSKGEAFMGLTEDFESAVSRSKQLPEKPPNDVLLKIYSLYKQATEGDVSGDEPGMFDFVAKAKYQAWEECKGLSTDESMQQYVDLIVQLEGK